VTIVAKVTRFLRCRDCGTTIGDEAEIRRLLGPHYQPADSFTVADDGNLLNDVVLPGACAACGGGRFVMDDGGIAPSTLRALRAVVLRRGN
jgi:hypothetical protein